MYAVIYAVVHSVILLTYTVVIIIKGHSLTIHGSAYGDIHSSAYGDIHGSAYGDIHGTVSPTSSKYTRKHEHLKINFE